MPNQQVILVSISCLVYNHAPYLERCLEGILQQKTSFGYEILIHDDASTDGSTDIILDYQQRYPDIIKPIYEKENQFSKGGFIGSAAWNFPRAKGKYIALCEGDDYWTDPMKLQKQVDYMETHPDCSLCFHNAIIHWDDGRCPDTLFNQDSDNKDYTGIELLSNYIIPTASVVFRRTLIDGYRQIMKRNPRIIIGDQPLALLAANQGKVHFLNATMSVYVRHPDSFVSKYREHYYAMARCWDAIGKEFGHKANSITRKKAIISYLRAASCAIQDKNYLKAVKALGMCMVSHPFHLFITLLKIPGEKKSQSSGSTER